MLLYWVSDFHREATIALRVVWVRQVPGNFQFVSALHAHVNIQSYWREDTVISDDYGRIG
jgi:hypothetical protein